VILDTILLCREGVLLVLPGLGRGEGAEDFVLTQSAPVAEGLDEGEDLGAGDGPVGPDAGVSLFWVRILWRGDQLLGTAGGDARSASAVT
jgi:hypothetical protein